MSGIPKEVVIKMLKYNRLRSQADNLQREIEQYLKENYGIYTIVPDDTYGMDGNCPIYKWGTAYFDIKQIKDIVDFKKDFHNRVGEDPEDSEVSEYFAKRQIT